ncbi:MAG TPA: hypothetical protein VJQ54_01055 [Candidatus Sulfotelmatobacter sp.]|nr:hypothetical protein [Candidatus Sulfotelmatobacter sp.]
MTKQVRPLLWWAAILALLGISLIATGHRTLAWYNFLIVAILLASAVIKSGRGVPSKH